MRIAVTNHHRKLVGGTESYLHQVIPELEARGHEVLLFHEAESGAEPCIAAKHHTRKVSKLASFRKNVIFNHGLQSPALENQLSTLAPVVHFAHNYHGTCISGEKTRKLPQPAPCPRRFGPLCLAEYLPRNCGGWNPLIAIRDFQTQSGRLEAMRRAHTVIAASRHMEAEYRNHQFTRVLRVPLFAASNPPLPPPPATPFRILFAGRMTRIKGAALLAAAAPLIRRAMPVPVEITFAGEGPERPEVQRLCPEADFPGWVNQAALHELAATHHLFAMPSIWPEPFGLAGLELGLPVTAFAVGGIPDWLTDGINGALAPAANLTPEAFAEAVVRCAKIPLARTNMHNTAQAFTLERHMDLLLPILEAACAS